MTDRCEEWLRSITFYQLHGAHRLVLYKRVRVAVVLNGGHGGCDTRPKLLNPQGRRHSKFRVRSIPIGAREVCKVGVKLCRRILRSIISSSSSCAEQASPVMQSNLAFGNSVHLLNMFPYKLSGNLLVGALRLPLSHPLALVGRTLGATLKYKRQSSFIFPSQKQQFPSPESTRHAYYPLQQASA